MKTRQCTCLAALLLALLTIAIPASAQTPAAEDANWHITDNTEITLGDEADIASLSPDGAWIAGQGEERSFCIWSTEDGTETCAGENLPIDMRSIAWAPDSSAVAFSLDAARLFIDSDIYLLDVESGDLENLTDDPDEADDLSLFGNSGEYVHADIMPAWSTDGEILAFVRGSMLDERNPTSIMTIDRDAGDIEQLFLLSPQQWLTVYSPIYYLPDDSLLIAVGMPDPDLAANGIWRLAPDGSRIDQLVQTAPNAEELAGTIIVDVSADGSQALLFSYVAYSATPFTIPPYHLLDIATGELTPFPTAEPGEELILPDPVFVGDSTEVAYLTRSDEGVTLMIGQEPVANGLEDGGGMIVLFASDADQVLVKEEQETGRFITLEHGEDEPAPCACTPPE